MRISEIFRSIQGESTYAGLPCTFVRTAGCPLRCSYCDTGYALDANAGQEMPLGTILNEAANLGLDLVEITGGEPLEQSQTPELCQKFLNQGAKVLIETSGAFPIDGLPPQVIKILDIKTPSSRMMDRNYWENLEKLSTVDEIKFVISDRNDFDWSVEVCRKQNLFHKNPLLFSPNFSKLQPVQLAEWIVRGKIPVRFQMQLHKYIWTPSTRGV